MSEESREQKIGRQLRDMVIDWADRLATHESTDAEVKHEMVQWVNLSENRLWCVAVSAAGCLKEMMQRTVTARTGLLVAEKGSWFIKSLGAAGQRNDRDGIAAVQTAIAMCNRDPEMAHDILTAHERVCGSRGLFGVALAATDAVAGMLELGVWVEPAEEGPDGLWMP